MTVRYRSVRYRFWRCGVASVGYAAGFVAGRQYVLYCTPTWAGFRFGAGYSWNGFGQELAGSGNNIKVGFLGVSWGAGPFYGVVTYDVIEPRATAGIAATAAAFSGVPRVAAGAADQKMLLIGATFDLKFMKIHGAYAKEDNVWFAADLGTGTGVNVDAGADADAWMVGLTFRLFGGELFGSYQTRDGDAVSVCLSRHPGASLRRPRGVTRKRHRHVGRRLYVPVIAPYQYLHRLLG